MSQRIRHDISFDLAVRLLEPVVEDISAEQWEGLFRLYYDTLLTALEMYDQLAERQLHRLNPTKN